MMVNNTKKSVFIMTCILSCEFCFIISWLIINSTILVTRQICIRHSCTVACFENFLLYIKPYLVRVLFISKFLFTLKTEVHCFVWLVYCEFGTFLNLSSEKSLLIVFWLQNIIHLVKVDVFCLNIIISFKNYCIRLRLIFLSFRSCYLRGCHEWVWEILI